MSVRVTAKRTPKGNSSQPAEPPQGRLPASGRLQRITNWEAIVVDACYSAPALARICGVSVRHLQRHAQSTFSKTLSDWLNEYRLKHAYERLAQGFMVKETAFSLGFKQVSHFSRMFKDYFGFRPTDVPISIETSSERNSSDSTEKRQMPLGLFRR